MFSQIPHSPIERALSVAERMARVHEAQAENPKAAAVDTSKLTVESVGTHVYFYSDVNADRCLAMIKAIRGADEFLRNERASRFLPDEFPLVPIWLHIHSGGGELHSGLAIADQLQQVKTPVYSIIEGYCASAATLISLACAKRFITPNSFMLVHQFSNAHWGTHETFKDEMRLQEMLIEVMVSFYVGKTKLPESEVREILKHDSWFNAQQCLDKGLVDGIIG